MKTELRDQLRAFAEALQGVMEDIIGQNLQLYEELVELYDLQSTIKPESLESILDRRMRIQPEEKPACNGMMAAYAKVLKLLPMKAGRHRNHDMQVLAPFLSIVDICSWGKIQIRIRGQSPGATIVA